jgi:hypothetical protein
LCVLPDVVCRVVFVWLRLGWLMQANERMRMLSSVFWSVPSPLWVTTTLAHTCRLGPFSAPVHRPTKTVSRSAPLSGVRAARTAGLLHRRMTGVSLGVHCRPPFCCEQKSMCSCMGGSVAASGLIRCGWLEAGVRGRLCRWGDAGLGMQVLQSDTLVWLVGQLYRY